MGNGSSLKRDPAGFWSNFIEKHRNNANDTRAPVVRRFFSHVMAAGLSVWATLAKDLDDVAAIWAGTLKSVASAVKGPFENFRFREVSSGTIIHIGNRAHDWVLRRDGGVKEVCKLICADIKSSNRVNIDIRKGIHNGVNKLWTYFKTDIVIPFAQREAALRDSLANRNSAANMNDNDDIVIDYDDEEIGCALIDQADREEVAVIRGDSEDNWKNFLATEGIVNIERGEDRSLDADYKVWLINKGARSSAADVVT